MRLGKSKPSKPKIMPIRAHEAGHPEQRGATTGKSGALRAAIFGVNDGLVSNLSLIMGVAGATGTDPQIVLLAGVAGLLAGAFSMGAGEYISMRVQRDVFEQLLALERWELENMPEEELHELTKIYEDKGMPKELATEVAVALSKDVDVALETHAREELGLDPHELGSPTGAAISSFIAFSLGALVPLFPFFFVSGMTGIVLSATLSGITLFAVGSAMTIFTGKHFWLSGLRMLAVGGGAATITYLVGSMFHVNSL
ncbi:MAG: VIT1/CCC1 transporter family protein [Actinomycetota bacterium]